MLRGRRMNIEIKDLQPVHSLKHLGSVHSGRFCYKNMGTVFSEHIFLTHDQMEEMEMQLTDIIKQFQDYRMKQNI